MLIDFPASDTDTESKKLAESVYNLYLGYNKTLAKNNASSSFSFLVEKIRQYDLEMLRLTDTVALTAAELIWGSSHSWSSALYLTVGWTERKTERAINTCD